MANVFKGRVWTLDTASADVVYTGWFKAALIYWRNPSAGGDLMLLNDSDSRPIIDARAEGANLSQVFRTQPMWYHGIIMKTLGSGTVQIHIL